MPVPDNVACRPVDPNPDAVAELTALFESYRIHYGQSPAPEATGAVGRRDGHPVSSGSTALALYRRCGFTINADLTTLSLDIAR